jgi:hypothetical protein
MFTADHQQYPYQDYTVEVRYIWDEGLTGIAIAADPGTVSTSQGSRVACEVVREKAPYGRKEVRFTGSRLGGPPAVPHPFSYRNDANEVFQHADVIVAAPAKQLRGFRRWRIRGTYTYILIKPIWVDDGLRSGATPYDVTQEAENVYPANTFNRQLQ